MFLATAKLLKLLVAKDGIKPPRPLNIKNGTSRARDFRVLWHVWLTLH
jgi:hypothetical protein